MVYARTVLVLALLALALLSSSARAEDICPTEGAPALTGVLLAQESVGDTSCGCPTIQCSMTLGIPACYASCPANDGIAKCECVDSSKICGSSNKPQPPKCYCRRR
jgi:hypothetical protein